MSTPNAITTIIYLSYDQIGRRDGQTDLYSDEYTRFLDKAYEAARAHHPSAKDAHEFIEFTGAEPPFYNTNRAQWVDLPHFYGARVCFFYDEAFECIRGIQRTQSGMRHVYRIEVDANATTYYHPVMRRDVPVPAAEARIVRWAWSSVPVTTGTNALDELRRRGATNEDPQWTVFPKEVGDKLEAAYESGAPAPTVDDVVLGAPLYIELGTPDLEGTRELGVLRCRHGSGNRFLVKRLWQTESHVLESSAQLRRRYEEICTEQQADGKNTDSDCCICMERLDSSPFDLLPCGHLAHRLCLQGCIEGHGGMRIRCPMCREVGVPVG